MTTKEKILSVTLELAAENGLGNVSMSQIADRLGIRKPSLYNHFESKEAIIEAMYYMLREKSKEQQSPAQLDYGEMVKDKTCEQALMMSVTSYVGMISQPELLNFYRFIYSQRSLDQTAARIMADETERMILATKNLFYALNAHGKLSVEDIDMAALSFAMTIHAMIDYQQDCKNCEKSINKAMLEEYVQWFSKQYGR